MKFNKAKHFSGSYRTPKMLKNLISVNGVHMDGSAAAARSALADDILDRLSDFDDRYGSAAGLIVSFVAVAAAGLLMWQNLGDRITAAPQTEAVESSITAEIATETVPWTDDAEVLPATAISPLPDYDAKAVFIDGKIAGRGYIKDGDTYLSIEPFLDRLGIVPSASETEETVTLTGQEFELIAYKGQSYIKANGRYIYVPGGALMLSSSGASSEAGGGAGGTDSSTGSGGNMYLPGDAVERIFNVEADESDETVNVSTENIRVIEGGENYYDITLDANIFYWLPHIVFSEAHDEPLESKLAVANVVLNRVKFDLFPDTIYGVIYDTKYAVQFSPVSIGGIKGTPDEESYVAAFLAVEGYNNVDNCMYYVNPNLPGANDDWFKNSLTYFGTIGSHDYYYKNGQQVPGGTVSPVTEG